MLEKKYEESIKEKLREIRNSTGVSNEELVCLLAEVYLP